ncbi:MAG: methyltransferase family protein [Pseudonocardiaceae bacterium]
MTPPQQALGNLINQLWKPQAIHVADRLHLAEALADGTHTVAQLAEMTGTHAPSLYRLLRALASIGIFTELDGSHFANSELSHFPRPDVPGSLCGMAAAHVDWMCLLGENSCTACGPASPVSTRSTACRSGGTSPSATRRRGRCSIRR